MEDIGEIPLLPDRRLTSGQKLRKWYARHFIDILDAIFLFHVGLVLLTLLCALGGIVK